MKNSQSLLKTILTLFVLPGIILFSGCKKNSATPDAGTSPKIAFGIKSDNFTTNLTAVGPKQTVGIFAVSAITWTSGVANVSKFKFEAKKANFKMEIETTQLLNVDLFSLTPALTGASIDTGTYKEIEVKVMFTKSATAAIPLTLKGTYTPASGTAVPVELYVNDELTIKVEAENVVIDNTKNVQSMISLHLNEFLTGINSAALDLATKTDGKIVISSSSNIDLYNKIKFNVSNSGDSKMEKKEKGEKAG